MGKCVLRTLRASVSCVVAFGLICASVDARALGDEGGGDGASAKLWRPFELSFSGPFATEADDAPNPFLDYRLQVLFTGPSGASYDVPGFFDGDQAGSGTGSTWKARFLPDELGAWTWKASFRSGNDVAISLEPFAGTPAYFDGATGSFSVDPPSGAQGFHAKGRLRYVGGHYLAFQDGTYFLKTGTDSPENLLGYSGFDEVADLGGTSAGIIHDYGPHVMDWAPGDPSIGAAGSPNGLKGLIGALNYLSVLGVNSVYFLPMNLGGDGQETTPFLQYAKTHYAKTHYDTSRLAQWNTVFEHAMRKGVQLQFVLAETEAANEMWLDEGGLGTERKLFFRELVARFGHHNALKWNLGEESDFSVSLLKSMADYLRAVDPYDHPLGVHTHVDDFSDYFALLGDPDFTITSIQYNKEFAGDFVEQWRANSAAAGHPWVIDMDENDTAAEGVSDQNADEIRKMVLYDVLFSGGNVEWYLGSQPLPLGGDQSLEDFRTREEMWLYSRYARELLQAEFPFWEMEPADHLLTGEAQDYGGGEVFLSPLGDLAIYLPKASPSGSINLTAAGPVARFLLRWFDPRTGEAVGSPVPISGGGYLPLGAPPWSPGEDWVVTIKRLTLYTSADEIPVGWGKQLLFLDGGYQHAFHNYQLLSSTSGISPGTYIGTVLLPLNWDSLTTLSLDPLPGFTYGFSGRLDADGRAAAVVDLTPVLGPSWIGLTLHHAYLAGPGADPTWASNAVPMTIVP